MSVVPVRKSSVQIYKSRVHLDRYCYLYIGHCMIFFMVRKVSPDFQLTQQTFLSPSPGNEGNLLDSNLVATLFCLPHQQTPPDQQHLYNGSRAYSCSPGAECRTRLEYSVAHGRCWKIRIVSIFHLHHVGDATISTLLTSCVCLPSEQARQQNCLGHAVHFP